MYWKAAISLKNKFKNYSQPYSGWLRYDENSYFDKTLFFTIYSYFDPVSSFKYFWYNIKQKFIFINLLLEVIFLVIFCQDIFANIFNNAPFVFALLLTQMKTYIKPKKSRNIFWNKFSLILGDVFCDPDKILLTSISIFQCRKTLTWRWSLDPRKMFISCNIVLHFIIVYLVHVLFFIFQ